VSLGCRPIDAGGGKLYQVLPCTTLYLRVVAFPTLRRCGARPAPPPPRPTCPSCCLRDVFLHYTYCVEGRRDQVLSRRTRRTAGMDSLLGGHCYSGVTTHTIPISASYHAFIPHIHADTPYLPAAVDHFCATTCHTAFCRLFPGVKGGRDAAGAQSTSCAGAIDISRAGSGGRRAGPANYAISNRLDNSTAPFSTTTNASSTNLLRARATRRHARQILLYR